MVLRKPANDKLKASARKFKSSKKDLGDVDEDFEYKSHIPKELDEDVDDDLAFNSDDEAKYGAFFSKPSSGKKSKNKAAEDRGGVDAEFDRLNAVGASAKGKGGKNEDDEIDFSDDSRDEFDISEMLDSKEDQRKMRLKRREGKGKKEKAGRKSTVKEPMTREAESLLGSFQDDAFLAESGGQKRTASVRKLLVSTEESAPKAKKRLDSSLANNKTVLTQDTDDITKERSGRQKVREIVAQQLQKYAPILKDHQKAPHLTFPLRSADAAAPTPTTLDGLVSAVQQRHDDTNRVGVSSMASKMNALLHQSGFLSKPDEDHANGNSRVDTLKFSQDDDAEAPAGPSIGYMQKLKSMLAFENGKRKRFNRIKSKTYRRILRKEKERDADRRQKAFELLHPEEARRKLALKMEKTRAEERATQKHKNTSKWVRHAKKFAKVDDETKDAIDEQHALHQRLMEKMADDAAEDMHGDAEVVSESEEEERVVDALLSGNGNAASSLWGTEEEASNENQTPVEKARAELKKMKFMENSKKRHAIAMSEDLALLEEDIQRYRDGEETQLKLTKNLKRSAKTAAGGNPDDDDALADEDEQKEEEEWAVKPNKRATKPTADQQRQGRVQFNTSAQGAAGAAKRGDVKVALGKKRGLKAAAESGSSGEDEADTNDDIEGAIDEDATEEQTALPLKKRRNEVADATMEFDFAGDRVRASQDLKEGRKKKQSVSTRVVVLPAQIEAKRAAGTTIEAQQGANQDYLVARAFASDEVDEEFLKQKERQVEDIMRPQDKNATLPGWGEWGGESERLNQQHKVRVERVELERKIEKSSIMKSRADAQLDNLIINHEVDLVPDRLTLHMVPRPFSNATEFSRSMRQPLGPEWNTALSFKEGTQARITTIQGVTIDPLSLTAHPHKKKTTRRKMLSKAGDSTK